MKTPEEYFREKTKNEILRMPPEFFFYVFDRDIRKYSYSQKQQLFIFLRSYAVAVSEGIENPGSNIPELIKNGAQIYNLEKKTYQNYRKIRNQKEEKPIRKLLKELPKGWEKLMEESGRKMESINGLILKLGISKSDYYRLLREEPKFQKAYEKYDLNYTSELEGNGVKHLKKGNSRIFEIFAHNKLGWNKRINATTDAKIEVQEKSPKQMTDEELDAKIKELGLPLPDFERLDLDDD